MYSNNGGSTTSTTNYFGQVVSDLSNERFGGGATGTYPMGGFSGT